MNNVVNILDILIVGSVVLLLTLSFLYLRIGKKKIVNKETKTKSFDLERAERELLSNINNLKTELNTLKTDLLRKDRVIDSQKGVLKSLTQDTTLQGRILEHYTFDTLIDTILEIKKKSDEYEGSIDVFITEVERLRDNLNSNSQLVVMEKKVGKWLRSLIISYFFLEFEMC